MCLPREPDLGPEAGLWAGALCRFSGGEWAAPPPRGFYERRTAGLLWQGLLSPRGVTGWTWPTALSTRRTARECPLKCPVLMPGQSGADIMETRASFPALFTRLAPKRAGGVSRAGGRGTRGAWNAHGAARPRRRLDGHPASLIGYALSCSLACMATISSQRVPVRSSPVHRFTPTALAASSAGMPASQSSLIRSRVSAARRSCSFPLARRHSSQSRMQQNPRGTGRTRHPMQARCSVPSTSMCAFRGPCGLAKGWFSSM